MIKRSVLQLNSSFEPIRIVSWKHALKLVTKGKAVVELPTSMMIYPGIYLPSVIRLREYHHVPVQRHVMTRKNIFVRDGYRCMYCGHHFGPDKLTLDHVIPLCQGGRDIWDNLVAACKRCNGRKGGRTPLEAGMALIRRPLPMSIHTSRFVLRSLGMEVNEWRKYMYDDSNGDPRYVIRGQELAGIAQ
jgi:hypothetical protein